MARFVSTWASRGGIVIVRKHGDHDQAMHGNWAHGYVSGKGGESLYYTKVTAEGGRTVGEARFQRVGKKWYVNGIEVDDDYRRHGAAQRMVEKFHEDHPDEMLYHGSFASKAGVRFAEAMVEEAPEWNAIASKLGPNHEDRSSWFAKFAPDQPRDAQGRWTSEGLSAWKGHPDTWDPEDRADMVDIARYWAVQERRAGDLSVPPRDADDVTLLNAYGEALAHADELVRRQVDLAHAFGTLTKDYDPDQPRDSHGRWARTSELTELVNVLGDVKDWGDLLQPAFTEDDKKMGKKWKKAVRAMAAMGIMLKHLGPGDHPSGTPQEVHSGGGVPPLPGGSPIPEGAIRLFHVTPLRNAESIREHGLTLGASKTNTYGEPSQIWASAGVSSQQAKRVEEGGLMDADMAVIEFWAMPDELDIGRGANPADIEARSGDVTFLHDVPTDHIVAIHEPWQSAYRYLQEYKTEVLAGEYDYATDVPAYAQAIAAIKNEAVRKHGDHDQSTHGNWAHPGTAEGGPETYYVEGTGWVVTPISRGPGPTMTIAEAQAWAKDSKLQGAFYHGGTGKSGLGARIWESPRGMDFLGRGYYVTNVLETANVYGRSGTIMSQPDGVTREVYLNIDKYLTPPEYLALRDDPEVKALEDGTDPIFEGTNGKLFPAEALQVVAQRRGYQAYVQEGEEGDMQVSVWDARRVAIVQENVRDELGLPHLYKLRAWVRKHLLGQHDQADHGNWATGGTGVEPRRIADLSEKAQANIAKFVETYEVDQAGIADQILQALSDPEARDAGARWYEEAYLAHAQELADKYDTDLDTAAAVVAITSAQNPWSRVSASGETVYPNLDTAERFLSAWRDGEFEGVTTVEEARQLKLGYPMQNGFGINVIQLLNGDVPLEEAVTGAKRRSFFSNGVDPYGSNELTLDSWMGQYLLANSPVLSQMVPEKTGSGGDVNYGVEKVKSLLAGGAPKYMQEEGFNASAAYVTLADAIMEAHDRAIEEGIVPKDWLPHQTQATAWMWVSRQGGTL